MAIQEPLPPESADELLDALLGPDAELGALKRILIERTGGKTALVSAKDALGMATDIHPASSLASVNMLADSVHSAR